MNMNPCKTCKGKSRVVEKKKVSVEIPPGVDNDMNIRVSGEGHGGSKGGPFGHLYVHLQVRPHKDFQREEDHLYGSIELGIAQAALGCKITVPTLEGKEEVTIQKGSQVGDMVTLKEQGVPSLRTKRRGNLYFEIKVRVPRRISKKQEQLLRDFAAEAGEKIN